MKNAFPKDIIALGKQGQDLEGLAIDLQAWFKRSSRRMILKNFQTKPF